MIYGDPTRECPCAHLFLCAPAVTLRENVHFTTVPGPWFAMRTRLCSQSAPPKSMIEPSKAPDIKQMSKHEKASEAKPRFLKINAILFQKKDTCFPPTRPTSFRLPSAPPFQPPSWPWACRKLDVLIKNHPSLKFLHGWGLSQTTLGHKSPADVQWKPRNAHWNSLIVLCKFVVYIRKSWSI